MAQRFQTLVSEARSHRWAHLATILLAAVVLRVGVVDYVGVWVDHGFYAYDTRLVLEGKTPFVDFLGRSPLFLYALAGWRWVFGYSPEIFRAFIATIWVLTTLPVYGIAREIADHQTAVIAAATFALLPFGVVYGYWMNTMSLAALLSTTAVWVVIAKRAWWRWPLAGGLLGAAFLSRRSVVAVGFALSLVAVVVALRDEDRRAALWRPASVAVGAGAVTVFGYLLLAGGRIDRTLALIEVHAVNLVISTGRGGWPLIGADVPPPTNSVGSGRLPLVNSVCQLCGAWTARTVAKGLLVTLPASALVTAGVLPTVREHIDDRAGPYLGAVAVVTGGVAAVGAVAAGHWLRVVSVVAFVSILSLAWWGSLESETIADRVGLWTVVAVWGVFVASYLYRRRVIHVYYAMDVWPFLAVLAAVAGVGLWRQADRPARTVLATALAVTIVTSAVAAYPMSQLVFGDNEAGWYTTETIPEFAETVEGRTDAGDIVLVKSATILSGTDARMPLHDSRSVGHMYSVYKDAGPARELYAQLADGMASGRVALVVLGNLTRRLLSDNQTTTGLFEGNYCRVRDQRVQRLYSQINATLYRHGRCADVYRPRLD